MIHRKPYQPTQQADLLEFIKQNSVQNFNKTTALGLLNQLTSSVDGVIDLWSSDHRILIASIIDTVDTSSNSAELVFLGRAEHPHAIQAFSTALEVAEDFVRTKTGKRRLDVEISTRIQDFIPKLQSANYQRSYSMYEMATGNPQVGTIVKELPFNDWQWRDARKEDASEYRALVVRAFKDIPGTGIPSVEFIAERFQIPGISHRLLMIDGKMIALVRCELAGDGKIGIVHMIGRDPNYKGTGLGDRLLTEAILGLSKMGAQAFQLTVAATNVKALALYQRFGFKITQENVIYSRAL